MAVQFDLNTLPERMRTLPLDPDRNIPVPWFVAWENGKPEFRAMDGSKFVRAIREKLCWVCGAKLGAAQKSVQAVTTAMRLHCPNATALIFGVKTTIADLTGPEIPENYRFLGRRINKKRLTVDASEEGWTAWQCPDCGFEGSREEFREKSEAAEKR